MLTCPWMLRVGLITDYLARDRSQNCCICSGMEIVGFSNLAELDRWRSRLYLAYCNSLRNLDVTITATEPKIASGLLVTWIEVVKLIISDLANGDRSRQYLSLEEAQNISGIDREVLLAAMVNCQLPSIFSNNTHRINYKNLEQFTDSYYYRTSSTGYYYPHSLHQNAVTSV